MYLKKEKYQFSCKSISDILLVEGVLKNEELIYSN